MLNGSFVNDVPKIPALHKLSQYLILKSLASLLVQTKMIKRILTKAFLTADVRRFQSLLLPVWYEKDEDQIVNQHLGLQKDSFWSCSSTWNAYVLVLLFLHDAVTQNICSTLSSLELPLKGKWRMKTYKNMCCKHDCTKNLRKKNESQMLKAWWYFFYSLFLRVMQTFAVCRGFPSIYWFITWWYSCNSKFHWMLL